MSDITEVFTGIFNRNTWGSDESVSGNGSSLLQTRKLRKWLPKLLKKLGVKTLLDVPCGDFNWMRKVDLGDISYIGGDIVEEIIIADRKKYRGNKKDFRIIDVIGDKLPKADLIICRDCFVHFSYRDISKAVMNLHKSGIKYLLLTTVPDHSDNFNIKTGDWRALNFEEAPFNFPKPITKLTEGCTEQNGKYADKSLALWETATLPKLNLK